MFATKTHKLTLEPKSLVQSGQIFLILYINN